MLGFSRRSGRSCACGALCSTPERSLGGFLEVRNRQEYRNDKRGEHLGVVCGKTKQQHYSQNYEVDDSAESGERKLPDEVEVFPQDNLAQNHADNYSRKTDYDGASAHVYVGKALILSQQCARKPYHAVGEHQRDDGGALGVDTLRL